jgi:hypothetical protein
MARGTRNLLVAVLGAVALTVMGVGVAFAASGGGYSPAGQNCPAGASDFATTTGQTYPGCHDVHIAVESGQMQNGDPAGGNTHYVDVGINQEPDDPGSKGHTIPIGLENLGEPGYEASPHSGCLSVNTAGTGAAPASDATQPTDPGSAGNASNGCGGNKNGLGFTAVWDYYALYCPLVAAVPSQQCEDTTPGQTTITPYTGTNVDQSVINNGLLFYFGADDNLDGGEHDGLGPFSDSGTPYSSGGKDPTCSTSPCPQNNDGAHNGSSDGGAILASVTPQNAGNVPSATHPEGLANFSVGFCADGICTETTTQQQSVYQGCGAADANGNAPCAPGTPSSGNVYDYSKQDPSVQSEPTSCNSGGAKSSSDASCGGAGMNAYRSNTPANMNAEPGVQVYADPDPSRSPLRSSLWPTPGVYVGTCGVYAGSPSLPTAGTINSTPIGNGAGQVAVDNPASAC